MNSVSKISLFVASCLILFSFSAYAEQGKSLESSKTEVSFPLYSKNPVLITLDGKPVTLEDIRDKKAYELSLQLFQRLQQLLPQYALKQLAKKHKEITAPDVTLSEAELKIFYEANNLQVQGSFEQMKGQIQAYLTQKVRSEKRGTQYQEALKKGWVISHLEAPSDFLSTASAKTAAFRGNPKAKVMLLEFSDYQCPFCKRIQSTISSLIDKYGDRVAFGYRHFPLPFHKEADEAAIAVECAKEQGQFEAMHQLLYSNQKAQQMKYLLGYARKLKIKNLKQYDQCLRGEKYRSKVTQDIADGRAIGITGTPGFLIGTYDPVTKTVHGEMISGAQPAPVFEALIVKYLKQ